MGLVTTQSLGFTPRPEPKTTPQSADPKPVTGFDYAGQPMRPGDSYNGRPEHMAPDSQDAENIATNASQECDTQSLEINSNDLTSDVSSKKNNGPADVIVSPVRQKQKQRKKTKWTAIQRAEWSRKMKRLYQERFVNQNTGQSSEPERPADS